MRFDDSLKTVLAAEILSPLGARAAFRQLVDLIGRGRALASPELLARLETLRARVPDAVRAVCARSLALVDPPVALIAFFANDVPDVAQVAVRAVRLDPDGWDALLPSLNGAARAAVLERHDLPPSVVRALDPSASVKPEAPTADTRGARFTIADIAARIATHRQDGDAAITPLTRFTFETDAGGVIRWIDAAPRGAVIGLTLDHRGAVPGTHVVDGIAAGAFRKRAAFSNARLTVPGESAIAGAWRIAATPMFDQATGGFTGMRGHARRPRAEEVAERPDERARAVGAEGLRRLVHELRTPTNAIAGFSELIEQQLLGPVAPPYRERAGDIRRQVGGLIGAIEDIDLAARIEGEALDVRTGIVPAVPLLRGIARDLAPLSALRGATLAIPTDSDACWSADPHHAERLVSRLLATLLSAAQPGEMLAAALIAGTGTLALSIEAPRAFMGRDEAALLSHDDEDASLERGAPLLGIGFALRLVRNLAIELGGRFVIADDRFTLLLPSPAEHAHGPASSGQS